MPAEMNSTFAAETKAIVIGLRAMGGAHSIEAADVIERLARELAAANEIILKHHELIGPVIGEMPRTALILGHGSIPLNGKSYEACDCEPLGGPCKRGFARRLLTAEFSRCWVPSKAAPSERKPLSDLIPTSWLDPLLTGPNAVISSHDGFYDGPAIERLLAALKKRIEEAENVAVR